MHAWCLSRHQHTSTRASPVGRGATMGSEGLILEMSWIAAAKKHDATSR